MTKDSDDPSYFPGDSASPGDSHRKDPNMLSMAPLLLHSSDIPLHVREALRTAISAEPDERASRLESAAYLLHQELELECADVRELFGLPAGGDCQ